MTLFDPALPEPAVDPGPPSGAQRVRLLVAYDGRGFHGFAAQPRHRTVGGVLAAAIERVVGHTVHLVCAGRTDTGVHAWGQVVHADLVAPRRGAAVEAPARWTPAALERLQRSCLKLLGPEIVVRSIDLAPEGFHARFSATGRAYRYTVLNRPVPDPFQAGISWHVSQPLDLRAMRLACDPLYGEQDFSSFCRRPPDDGSLMRRVELAEWHDLGDGMLRFDIEASSFCHQMVRSLVGTMVDVGLGRRPAGDMAWILRARDRAFASSPAPPTGLCLWRVDYPSGYTCDAGTSPA
jgi:tRNA pseudouridine38-40 synthase